MFLLLGILLTFGIGGIFSNGLIELVIRKRLTNSKLSTILHNLRLFYDQTLVFWSIFGLGGEIFDWLGITLNVSTILKTKNGIPQI
ncbi:MAG: hypothetical protein IPN86_08760 [Saprospiraceae bacterium]|nr:hypothetical protein [Saprospiraceae bacterium]